MFCTSSSHSSIGIAADFLIAGAISLTSGVSVLGAQTSPALSAEAVVESRSGGFEFPDATIQNTAAAAEELAEDAASSTRSLSVREGLYDNRIRGFTHALAFVEVCFKDGSILSDQNDAGTSTTGGNCEPGDVGWILEANNRAEAEWTSARETCLHLGMRLPEIFEFQFSCRNADSLGLSAEISAFEWMMNTPELTGLPDSLKRGAAVVGGMIGNCDVFDLGFIGGANVTPASMAFRCAL